MKLRVAGQRRAIRFLTFLLFGFAAELQQAVAENDTAKIRELGVVKPKQLSEVSGLVASRKHPGLLWLHNDGDSGLLFAITTSGKLAALVGCPVKIDDFEDIAIGPNPKTGRDDLYLADIGDNDQRRREIRVVRMAEPDLAEADGDQIHVESADVIRLRYPDGAHDAEALIVDPESGDLFIVTKDSRKARLFRCPAKALNGNAVTTLERVDDLDVAEISSAAIAPDGSRIILRRETRGWIWNRDDGQSVAAALQGPATEIPVLGKRQGPNGEAVSFSPDGRSYYTVSEGKSQAVYSFPVPAKP